MLVYMPLASGLAIRGDIFRTMSGLADDSIAPTGHGATLSEGAHAAGEPPLPQKVGEDSMLSCMWRHTTSGRV